MKKQLLKKYQIYAKKNGFHLNSDKKIVNSVFMSLIKREKEYGKRYCPCRVIIGNKEDKKNICPCVYHKKEIETLGRCHCSLFVK